MIVDLEKYNGNKAVENKKAANTVKVGCLLSLMCVMILNRTFSLQLLTRF